MLRTVTNCANGSWRTIVRRKSVVIDKDILEALQADPAVWETFPVLYQHVRIDTIQIKKKQPELFCSRLQKLIDNTKKGIMYGEWNDNGRLF